MSYPGAILQRLRLVDEDTWEVTMERAEGRGVLVITVRGAGRVPFEEVNRALDHLAYQGRYLLGEEVAPQFGAQEVKR